MTATLKYREVPNDDIKLTLFPYLLEGAAKIWYEKEPPSSILTWDDLVNKFVNQFFPPSKTTHLKNEISHFTQRFEETFGEAWDRFKEMLRACLHHEFSELTQIDTFYNGLTEKDQDSLNAASGGNLLNKTTRESLKIIKNKSKVHYSRSKSNVSRVNTNSRDVVSKTDDRVNKLADQISNLVEIVNKQVIAPAKAVEKTCVTCGGAHAYYDCIVTDIVLISILKPDVLRTQSKPSVPYPSRLNDQKLREKTTNQMEKFFQIFHDLHFDISFADALLLMPKFGSTIKSLLANKDKLFELAKVPLNENCSAMLLKKLSEKLGDSGKFLIPCDFPRIEVCHALADLGASINLMPLSIWKKLSLPELTPTRMTLELVDSRSKSSSNLREVILEIRSCFNRCIWRGNTVRVNDESINFNLNQTMRYSLTYDDNSMNRVDVIDIACEDFMQDVLDFQYNPKSSSPTLVSDSSFSKSDSCKEPIVKSSSPTLTPFGESDFFLEEIEYFLNDDSIPTGIENSVYDPEGDILFIEKLLNEDPFQLPLMDLKLAEESKAKSSIEEPPELELKELPSHLEYAFLEDSNKLPVIIAKNLKDVEIEALINVLSLINGLLPGRSPTLKPVVNPIYCVPKKGGMTVVANEKNELIPIRLVTGWRVCIDYRKLNDATRKDHFPLPFMDQMLERLAGNEFYCFLDGFLGYFQIPIDLQDQEKTTFTCPYGTFGYQRMPFGLCDAPGHKISKSGIEVDRAKVDVIAKLPHPTTIKGVRSFLGHAGFYRRFIQDFLKIARPMTHLLEKKTPFVFSKECIDAFDTLKKKLTEDLILVVPDWNLPFELMCDASDFAISAVLGQHKSKHFQPIHYASKTMTEAQTHYTTTEKEMLAVVYAFEKFWPYLVLSKSIVYTNHSALKYFLNKQDANPSDRGAHFCNDQFTRVMIKYGVTHRLSTAYHPQTSGQVEVSNHGLKRILKRTMGENRASWTKKLHDSKIKNRIFNVGDQVLLFNSRLKIFSGKLKTHWSGPFTITRVFPYGTIELSQPNGLNFKVNGHRVKHYFGGDIPSNVAPDLHTFPMDN
nr:DNA-directed DNA polymerase [Tanacetum cinerariifolium]